jgi:hypothetical protein
MARDVQFHFDPPARTWKDEHYGQVPVRDTNIFRNGIESFPPGKQITLWFDRYPDRIEQGLPDGYDVRISYSGPSGKQYVEVTVLDLGMYRDIGLIERYGIHDVHSRLKEIERTLKRWTHPEGVKVLSRDDRKRYAEELRAEMEQRESAAERGTTDETANGDEVADDQR